MSEHTPLFGGNAEEKVLSAAEGRKLAGALEAVARWAVYLSVLLIPVFYVPGTLDALELPKQALLVVLTVVAVVAWLGKMLVSRKLELRRSPMHLLVAVYLALYAVSAWASQSRYASFVGDFGQQKAGLASLACFVLLYFVSVNVLKDSREVRKAAWFLLIGGLAVLVHGFMHVLGLRWLPGTGDRSAAFNLVGTTNSLGALAAALLAMAMGLFLMPDRDRWSLARKIALGVLGVLGAVYVATLAFWALWVMIIVASVALVAYGMVKTDKVTQVTMLSIPMAAVVIGVVFIFIRFPISLGQPAEVMPSLTASWNVAREALASNPLLGSGPGTFLYDYTKFRSKDLNLTDFWSVQFDRSSSRMLTLLATTGILGLAAFLAMVVFLGVRTALKLARGREDWLLTLAVFAGWLALLVGKLFYSSNMTLEAAFWTMTSWLVVLEWKGWSEARFENSPRAALMLSFLFIVAVIFSVAGLYLQGQRYVAERHFSKGATRDLKAEEDVDKAMESLVRAGQLNPRNDLYFRTLAQAFALRANLELQKTGNKPTEEQSRQIVLLAANAVNAGKRATELNPANVQNWAALAAMYRDLGPATPGAVEAAEAAYAKSIELDPNNPVYHTELGRILLAKADAEAAKVSRDAKEEEKSRIQATVEDLLRQAREKFDKSIELKQDYAPAHYWVAVILERQGKTGEALAKLESVRNYNPNDLGVGFQLAILYYQNGDKDKAIAELERLVRLNAQYSNARWYLASMYEEKGRLDDAIAQIEEVKKANPGNADVEKRLEDLKVKKSGGGTAPEGLPEPVEAPAEQPAP